MVYTGDDDFDWDEANIGHVGAHGVEPWEAEDAVLSADRIVVGMRRERSESRRTIVGRTETDRILAVIYTVRAGRIRVVTARKPTNAELRVFRRRRRHER